MKPRSPLVARLATLGGLLAAATLAPADEWASLSGTGDHVVLKQGQTALIVGASERVVVHFDKPGSNRAAFRIASIHPIRDRAWVHTTACRRLPSEVHVSISSPLPIAGPGKLELRSPGIVSMQILGPQQRATR